LGYWGCWFVVTAMVIFIIVIDSVFVVVVLVVFDV
jgi:hypothetical protein